MDPVLCKNCCSMYQNQKKKVFPIPISPNDICSKRIQGDRYRYDPIEDFVCRQMLGMLQSCTSKRRFRPYSKKQSMIMPCGSKSNGVTCKTQSTHTCSWDLVNHKRTSTEFGSKSDLTNNSLTTTGQEVNSSSARVVPTSSSGSDHPSANEKYIRMFECSLCGSSVACSAMSVPSPKDSGGSDFKGDTDHEYNSTRYSTESVGKTTVEIPILHLCPSKTISSGSTLVGKYLSDDGDEDYADEDYADDTEPPHLPEYSSSASKIPSMSYSQTTNVDSTKSISLGEKPNTVTSSSKRSRKGTEVSFDSSTGKSSCITRTRKGDRRLRTVTKAKSGKRRSKSKGDKVDDHRIREIDQRLNILTSQYQMWQGLIKREETRWKEKQDIDSDLISDSFSI